MPHRISLFAALAIFAFVAGCATPPVERAPTPVRSVDAARLYTGAWREIGRRPMNLTDGCVAGASTYTRTDDTHLRVRDTCQRTTPDGPEAAIGGPAVILNPGQNTKFRVHYRLWGFIPIQRDYWILDHDDEYTWFISTDPTFNDLWIYTRSPRPGEELLARLVTRARELGYDTTRLEFPAQP